MGRWSTLVVDEASVFQLGTVDAWEVARHANLVAERRLRPHELYGRWEKQQWSADDVSLGQDKRDFESRLPRKLKQRLGAAISTFIVGEYTGLDLLAPVMLGAPDEEDLLFLGTQVADEARHARLMFRVGHEVLGYDSDPTVMLRQAWDRAEPEHRELALIEGRLMRESAAAPLNYENWLRSVTLFHLVTEGVMAVSGQRAMLRNLSRVPVLPGIRSAFAAMCRDESRHISFGLHSLRIGILEGHAESIYDVLEQTMPLALAISSRVQPDSAFTSAMGDNRRAEAQTGIDSFARGMRWIGADKKFTRHIIATAQRTADASRSESTHSAVPHNEGEIV